MPLRLHVLAMVAGALALLAALLWLLMSETTSPLSPSPDDQTILEVVRLAFYAVAGIGGVIALTVAYRRQRITESEIVREDAKLFNERFAAAADQLSSERAANRLAGVYAMAALADEWDTGRQTCVNVLCAYVRMPYEPPPKRTEREKIGLQPFKEILEERLVRKTVMTVIGDRLRAEPIDGKTWHECDFDFTGATFDECDLHRAVFKGRATFSYARFPVGVFDFNDAQFHGPVDFSSARFTGARVFFDGAEFYDDADFSRTTLSKGWVYFRYCRFRATRAWFSRSTFSGGELGFEACEFPEGSRVSFQGSAFSGTVVWFSYIEFEKVRLDFTNPQEWSHPPQFNDFPEGPPTNLLLPETEPETEPAD